jgi:membrane protease YdiL (CAAX protease family)
MATPPKEFAPSPAASHHDALPTYQTKPNSGFAIVFSILLFTTAVGLLDGTKYGSLYVFGYIMVISYTLSSVRRGQLSKSDIGIKRAFLSDLRRVWYYIGADALLFQIMPPTLGLALVFGYLPEELQHVTGRLASDFAGVGGMSAVVSVLALMAVLTLMEELVFRVTIQERLRWLIGTPAAILVTTCIFGLVHAVGTSGNLQLSMTDALGVGFDGVFFGIIYAKTHNLAVTWLTHYLADVVGLLSLAFII